MPSCLSLKEVLMRLTDAALQFAPMVKSSLQLWASAAEELPRYLQVPDTAAAMHAVHTALRQAPPSFLDIEQSQVDPRLLDWLVQYLPDITATLQQCARSQLDIVTKRLGILQTLAISGPQLESAQLSARIEAERCVFLTVEALTCILLVVVPVTALFDEMTLSDGGARSYKKNRQHISGQLSHSLQQRKELIERLVRGLRACGAVREPLKLQLIEILKNFEGLGSKGPSRPNVYAFNAKRKLLHAGIVWLRLLADLPTIHSEAKALLICIDWGTFDRGLLPEKERAVGVVALRKVFTHSELRKVVVEFLKASLPQDLFCQLLHDSGMGQSAEGTQLPPCVSEDTTCGSCSTSGVQRLGEGSSDSVAPYTDISDNSDNTDGGAEEVSLGDMQSLLRMMYGDAV